MLLNFKIELIDIKSDCRILKYDLSEPMEYTK